MKIFISDYEITGKINGNIFVELIEQGSNNTWEDLLSLLFDIKAKKVKANLYDKKKKGWTIWFE